MAVRLRYALAITRRKDEGHAFGSQPVGDPQAGLVAEIDIEKREVERLPGQDFHGVGDARSHCHVGAQAAPDGISRSWR